ncbi:MAG: IS4 family transposase [Candidatus Omnitrophica bacterium]|nr:IS4 family transposase [Candidatus Omnitrophota bacterium]MBU1852366.1 IS4 family transposase [Candidatus Omnitrophota bacterium]
MNTGKTTFSQIMDFLPMHEFRKCVNRYQGNYKVQSFSCFDQFLCMAFAQLTFRESLRDIEACLRSVQSKLYHVGFRGKVSRNTLAHANENRDWRIYADFAQILIGKARKLYVNDSFGLDLNETVYALDSSTIDLCLSLFPWAHFRKRKGAIKLHTLLDLRGPIPSFIKVTDGSVNDVNILDDLIIEPGAFYIFDRAYLDFERLFRFKEQSGFFITRTKKNFRFQRIYSHPVDKSLGLICDQTIRLTGFYSKQHYPEKLRRIRYFDSETQKYLTFLTNNFSLPAIIIAQLYKCRWQVELFFKWIKQHLRIKAFYGTSENAVKTQVWIAISIYVLIAIIKKQLKLKHSLYTILQILSVTIFEKTPILQVFATLDYKKEMVDSHNQLLLFDL